MTLSVPIVLTRMWYTEKRLRADDLFRVIRNNRNKVETDVVLLYQEILEPILDYGYS